MRITGRELRQVIRETLMMEMRGRHVYGGPPPMFDPEEMADAEDDSFFGGPPELSPEEMEDMWGDTGPDDVPHDSGPEWALRQGFEHRRKSGYRKY